MPANAVYERTRAGLTGLVPSRAARRILDAALRSERRSPRSVRADEMARLLLGPVLRDLSGVLPSIGLRRELKRLARSLRGVEQEDDPDGANAASAHPTGSPASRDADTADLIACADVVEPLPPPRAPAEEGTGRPATALPTDPARVMAALAVLEGIAGIAVFTAVGGAMSARGDLPDAAGLGRVIAAAGALLGRHGALRSVCITTTHGVLVAVPVPPLWLALTGERDMNLGAVYAALAALEEER